MDYIYWLVIGLFFVALGIAISMRNARKSSAKADDATNGEIELFEQHPLVDFESVSALEAIKSSELVRIENSTVISSISNLIPSGAELLMKSAQSTGETLYRAVLGQGQVLAKSREMAGAYRGIAHGGKGVASQANLVPVDPTKAASLASGVVNVMGVAAMVVGQYYMTEINGKLESLGKDIHSISNLLNQEIDGAILAKVAAVEAISAFSAEILSSPAERNRQLQALKIHKDDVSRLVGQANLAIKSNADTPDFKQGADGLREYKSKIEEVAKLTQRQQILMTLFSQICDLEFALGLGEVSLAASRYEFNKYDKASAQVKAHLASWHERQIEALKIDFEKSRAIKGPIASLVGFLNEDWKYMRIDEEIQASIKSQSSGSSTKAIAPADAFNNNVEIVIRNGEYWYRKPEAYEN